MSVPNAPSLPAYIFYKLIGFSVFGVSLPFVLIYHTLRHFVRPSYPTWSLRRELAISGGRLFLNWTSRFCLPRPEGKKAWKPDNLVHAIIGKGTTVDAVTIPPVDPRYISGFLAVGEGIVKPEHIPGFWTYEVSSSVSKGKYEARPDENVIMYISGGSWVMGHPMGTPFPYYFCRTAHVRVLAVNPRKAMTAETAFPAPLQDAFAGYMYLLGLNFRPNNIILVGDSSGAHIMMALTRYISDISNKEDPIGMPSAVILISPSMDLSHPHPPSIETDFLSPHLNNMVYPSMSRHYPPDALATNPYFSPAVAGNFEYLVQAQREADLKLFIQHGDVELLTPNQNKFIKKLQDEGVQVDLDVVEGGAHLDPGIAFALLERKSESSWVRLLDAVRRYTMHQLSA